jgi:hypothetical protein
MGIDAEIHVIVEAEATTNASYINATSRESALTVQ